MKKIKWIIGLLMLIFIYVKLFCNDNHIYYDERVLYSNNDIVKELKNEFYNRKGYRQMAEILYKVNYPKKLSYTFYSCPSFQHKLMGDNVCLNDTFPWVVQEMKKISGDKRLGEFHKENDVVYLGLVFRLFHPNKLGLYPYYIYSQKSEQSLLSEDFNGFIICDTIDDNYRRGWMLRLEKNWFIVSPDSSQLTDVDTTKI